MPYPSFLDQVGGWPSSPDPITGKPTRPYTGPYPPQDPGSAATDVMPAAAAPASPAAAAPSASSFIDPTSWSSYQDPSGVFPNRAPGYSPVHDQPASEAPYRPGNIDPNGIDSATGMQTFLNAQGQRTYTKPQPVDSRQMAYAPPGSDQDADIRNIQSSNPNVTVVPAQNYDRVGGVSADVATAGMSPAAKAAVMALMQRRPDATGTNLTTGQSFVMPGGNFVPAGAAMAAGKQADLQVAQQQEQAQRAKADAWKEANSPSALQAQKEKAASDLWAQQHPPAPAPVAAVPAPAPPSQGYQDAQTLASKLDLTNPQHYPVIAQLRQVPQNAPEIPQALQAAAGQLLHPAAPAATPGQAAVAGMQKATQVASQPDVQQSIAALAQFVSGRHWQPGVDEFTYNDMQNRAVAAMQAYGVDQASALKTVRAMVQQALGSDKAHPENASFLQAPEAPGEFQQGAAGGDDVPFSGSSWAKIAGNALAHGIPGMAMMSRAALAAKDEQARKYSAVTGQPSFLNQ